MLNLDKINQKLEAVLKNETEDSLNEWLFRFRNKDLINILGEGSFTPTSSFSTRIAGTGESISQYACKQNSNMTSEVKASYRQAA